MSTRTPSPPSPSGLALALILIGAVVTMTATGFVFATHTRAWQLVVAGGSALAFVGWVLHGRRLRRLRGGAA
ncbi:hypothetical protein ACFWY6_04520 [Streptomyces sp. NPDC059037]|uniref:hypothetical protein n=1 Tax=Streptomyces sp. NPDC059037 TaxID=3346710 RepID=UPI0036B0DAE7